MQLAENFTYIDNYLIGNVNTVNFTTSITYENYFFEFFFSGGDIQTIHTESGYLKRMLVTSQYSCRQKLGNCTNDGRYSST